MTTGQGPAELGTTDDPRTLIPGDPTAVTADARTLTDRATGLAHTGQALRRIDTGSWTGQAAQAWRDHHDTDVPRWLQAADSLDAAADALTTHADALTRAQNAAARAITLWRTAEAATTQARADHDRATAAGAPVPAFVDPGDEPRRAAQNLLTGARAELQRSGDRVAAALRGEAGLAPQDSQKHTDAEFYRGIRDSVAAAGTGAWTLLSNPTQAVAGVAQAAAHPVDTAQDAVAWNDWTHGHEPRALGRNTGDMILGIATLGAGKITSALGRGAHIADEPRPPGVVREPGPAPAATTPAARVSAVRDIVFGADGKPHGWEDRSGVFMIDERKLEGMRSQLAQSLGPPSQVMETRKGKVEIWKMDIDDARMNVTYRSFSNSGGPTIDLNDVEGIDVRRFHIEGGGR